jgi:hypothetical protein
VSDVLWHFVTPSGVTGWARGHEVQVGNDPVRRLPFRISFPHASDRAVVCVSADDRDENPQYGARAFRIWRDGSFEQIADWRGAWWPVYIDGDDRVFVLSLDRAKYYEFVDGRLTNAQPTPTTEVNGFAQVVNGEAVFYDARKRFELDDRVFAWRQQFGRWTLGTEPAGNDRVIAHNGSDWFQVSAAKARLQPRGVLLANGRLLVACHGVAGGWIDSAAFTPLVDVPASVVIPNFRRTSKAIGIGEFGAVHPFPRIIGKDEEHDASTEAVLFTLGDKDRDGARDRANALKRQLLIYPDRHGLKASDVGPDRGLVFAYPTPGLSVRGTLELVRADCERLRDARIPFCVAGALYRQFRDEDGEDAYPLSEQKVLDVLAGVWDIAIETGAEALWLFAKWRTYQGRLVDGSDMWPSFQKALARLRAASGNWRRFPRPSIAPLPSKPTTPQEEEELDMIAYGSPIAGFRSGDLVKHPDNGLLYAVKKANGKFLCITPDGAEEERDAPSGDWEWFRKGANYLIAEREGGRVYVLPFAA